MMRAVLGLLLAFCWPTVVADAEEPDTAPSRVAKKYLKAEALTVAIYGTPAEEDLSILRERYGLKVLGYADVFTGGYEDKTETQD